MNERRHILPFVNPPQGEIGGHASVANLSDPLDINLAGGVFERLENTCPAGIRGDLGAYTKRRAIMHRSGRSTSYAAKRIANLVYAYGMQIAGNIRDLLVVLHDGDNQIDLAFKTYVPSILYTAGNLSAWAEMTELSTPDATNNAVYATSKGKLFAGVGDWKPSALGHINMAYGAYLDSYPARFTYANRDKDSPYYNGFFASPNNSASDGGGRVEKTGYCVVPEKTWTSTSGFSIVLDGTRQDELANMYGDAILYQTGSCRPGRYEVTAVPVDDLGEEGPPLAYKSIDFPFGKMLGDQTYWIHGFKLVIKLLAFDGAIATLRPNIRYIRLYGRYTNTSKGDAIWTRAENEAPDGRPGFGLAIEPPDIPWSWIKDLPTCGRQYDPTGTDAWPAGPTAGTWISNTIGWNEADDFNRFVCRSGTSIRAEKTTGTTFKISKFDSMYRNEFEPQFIEEYLTTDTDKCYIEIKDRYGVAKIDAMSLNEESEFHVIWVDTTLPGAIGNIFDIRFCCPWQDDTGSNYSILVWEDSPENWDQSKPLNFPDSATEDWSSDYPNYTSHCESPDGAFRLCWNYWLEGQTIKNILKGSTSNYFGIFETGRFRFSMMLNGEITGAAFLDGTRFIVSTREGSYLGEYKQNEEGFWVPELTGEELLLGNIAGKGLLMQDRIVYGVDPVRGLWSVTVDPTRTRTDITPVGEQLLLMRPAQQLTLATAINAALAETIAALAIVPFRHGIRVMLPDFTGAASGGAKNHISIKNVEADSGSYWWTVYMPLRDGLIWSLDYGRDSAESADGYISLLDAQFGPAKTMITHNQTDVIGESDLATDEQDNIDASNAMKILQYIQPPRLRDDAIFPGTARIIRLYPRLIKFSSTAIEVSIVVTPYRNNVSDDTTTKSSITADGWLRGISSLGDSWGILISDVSSGTPLFKELLIVLIDTGRRR